MHTVTIVILPLESRDTVAEVTHLMAPYDMELSVPPWKQYVPQNEVDYLLEVYAPYGLRRDDIDAVVAALREDTGFMCGHDDGGYWWMFTANPQGKWDGWRLMNPQDDPWPTTVPLPEHLYPAAVVTPDGVWHDLLDMSAPWDLNYEQATLLRARTAELLAQYPTHAPWQCIATAKCQAHWVRK